MGMGIRFDERIVKTIVQALYEAVTVGIPLAQSNNMRATTNCYPSLGVDVIHEHILKLVNFDGVLIHRIKRHNWTVFMIIDNNAHNAYFVLSENNLKAIPAKKGRSWPHYLQSLLHEYHRGFEGKCVQQSFLPIEPFDDVTYEKDVERMLGGLMDDQEAWNIYVIAHKRNGKELVSVKQYFLSPSFDVIDERNLIEYIVPDYSAVINPIDENTTDTTPESEEEELIKLKPKPRPASEMESAPVVKPNEYGDVG